MAVLKKIPVILDTDPGTDIDDSYAIAMLLKSPELDVKLITTATADMLTTLKNPAAEIQPSLRQQNIRLNCVHH